MLVNLIFWKISKFILLKSVSICLIFNNFKSYKKSLCGMILKFLLNLDIFLIRGLSDINIFIPFFVMRRPAKGLVELSNSKDRILSK